ncbi:hypothetical protein U1Q18_002316 [Sarracenia purpurea var. burkii]
MWLAGGRRIVCSSSLTALLMISIFHVWFFCDCRVGAIRSFPSNGSGMENETAIQTLMAAKENQQDDLLQKYFNGGASDRNSSTTRNQNGFQQSKRRVPTCPDPLHN